MNKYVLLKSTFNAGGINACYISGMTLKEICNVLKAPSELLLTYNECDTFCRLKKDDFLRFIRNRREYYDIVCSDINTYFTNREITEQDAEDLLKFTEVCTPTPVLWLPSIANNFCVYSHDESLYSYLCFKTKPEFFAKGVLNCIVSSLSNETEMNFESKDINVFLTAIQNGIFIDTEHTEITNNAIRILVGTFDTETDFSGNLYSEKLPEFEKIKLRRNDR